MFGLPSSTQVTVRYIGTFLATGAYVSNWAALNAFMANNVSYLLCSHEQQMFHSVSHSWHARAIGKISNIDIERSAGLVSLVVLAL